jgi:hypothetical protein
MTAAERSLPMSETAKVMSYLRTRDVISFIKPRLRSAPTRPPAHGGR